MRSVAATGARVAVFAIAGLGMPTLGRSSTSCREDARFNELDFWLGTWDVTVAGSPPEAPLGRSVVTKILENCVVLESWSSPGTTGQSFNIFDRSRNQWHQTWVDVRGALHSYWGELKHGNMVYIGDLPPRPQTRKRRLTRLTFFNLGPTMVRQLSEDSADGGKTWTTNFDLIYTRRQPSGG